MYICIYTYQYMCGVPGTKLMKEKESTGAKQKFKSIRPRGWWKWIDTKRQVWKISKTFEYFIFIYSHQYSLYSTADKTRKYKKEEYRVKKNEEDERKRKKEKKRRRRSSGSWGKVAPRHGIVQKRRRRRCGEWCDNNDCFLVSFLLLFLFFYFFTARVRFTGRNGRYSPVIWAVRINGLSVPFDRPVGYIPSCTSMIRYSLRWFQLKLFFIIVNNNILLLLFKICWKKNHKNNIFSYFIFVFYLIKNIILFIY